MSSEDFINIIRELESENIDLSDQNRKLEAERDKMLIQIGKGTLDWILKKGEAGEQGKTPFEAQKSASYAGAAKSKSVTLIARLDPEVDTSKIDGNSMDKLFKSNDQWPTIQHFSKKNYQARLVFNSAADAAKAEKILKKINS